ncbi:hypothetical protein Xmar_07700 [Xanthomonas axonopodis pv. martyniicola]|uniref:TipJ family phage tail tip protein n=1 Tax=Xanthomonas axonopodis TaxID=53413 RepID=UPI0009986345|nr:hypothetical protein [Xanthomonas axonopodis]OOW67087.1 hypothetical protein Xmar_07700 [Xanthomonas axonopodis pv. martyniicola]OOW90160.1 hypothetical protein Xvtr_19135 [Xanthomonas campestris pv. vitiscarnosae]
MKQSIDTTAMVLQPHEFSSDRGLVYVRAGQTLQQMLDQAAGGGALASDLIVRVGGYDVPRTLWARVRPKAGVPIHVTRQRLAGGSVRQILAAVVMIVVAIWAPYLGAAAATATGFGTAAVWGAAITLTASLAVSALLAPPTPSGSGNSPAQAYNQLTGSSNQINPWGVLPIVLGRARLFPPHAALPYSEALGEDSYQHCLFDLGHGDIEVSDIRIGDTPINQFDDVQYEITRTPTLYTNDVQELAVGTELNVTNANAERTTAPDVDRISVDLVLPQGLIGYGDTGKPFDMWVLFEVQYRSVSSSTWQAPASPRLARLAGTYSWSGSGTQLPNYPPGNGRYLAKAQAKDPFAAGVAWDVPRGQYVVRIRRLGALRGSNKNTYLDAATWTVMRSIRNVNPSTTGTNKLAARIRATGQLNGTLQTLSCTVQQRIPVYDRGTGAWSAPQASNNTAWVAWWLMTTCPALSTHAPTGRMDLDGFANYADHCTLHQLETGMVCDTATTARELINKVLGGSLGSLGHRDGRYTVVYDHGDSVPSWCFTPLEISEFRMSRKFVRLPHALRVQFKNPDADWQDDEIIVLRDGYSYRGVDARGSPSAAPAATRFEELRLEQGMDARQAWVVGRYHLAQGEFRPNTYTWNSDIAGLTTTRGDVVDVAHDVAEWGTGWGRVVSITAGGPAGAAALLVLNQEIETQDGVSYGAQMRLSTGARLVQPCTPHSTLTNIFYLQSMPDGLKRGDAVVIGQLGQETAKLLITGVRNQRDLGTSFTAVGYDARVAQYIANAPNAIISEVSGRDYGLPAPPVIVSAVSAAGNDVTDDAGVRSPTVRIGISRPSHVRYYLQ